MSSEFCQFRIIHHDRHTFPSLNRLGGWVFSGPQWSAVCSCRVDITPNSINALLSVHQTAPVAQVVVHPLWYREVVGSIPGRAMPNALKMLPVTTLVGAKHYKASTGFSSPNVSHN